jgi:hypothetical protein
MEESIPVRRTAQTRPRRSLIALDAQMKRSWISAVLAIGISSGRIWALNALPTPFSRNPLSAFVLDLGKLAQWDAVEESFWRLDC